MPDVRVRLHPELKLVPGSSFFHLVRSTVAVLFGMPISAIGLEEGHYALGCETERPLVHVSVTVGDKPERRDKLQDLADTLHTSVFELAVGQATWSSQVVKEKVKVVMRLAPTAVATGKKS